MNATAPIRALHATGLPLAAMDPAIRRAHADGATWQEIADALGVSLGEALGIARRLGVGGWDS